MNGNTISKRFAMGSRSVLIAGAAASFAVTGCNDSVGGTPSAPEFVSVPVTSARVGVPYVPVLLANDPDGGGVDYELIAGPEGLAIDADTGAVQWTPAAGQLGTHVIHVRAEDGEDETGELLYGVVVTLNAPPQILGAGLTTACTGEALETSIYAVDPDGDAVTLEVIDPPAGFTLDETTGAVTWSPSSAEAGQHVVELHAADPYGGESTTLLALEVEGYNANPAENSPLATEQYAYESVAFARAADGIWAVVVEEVDDGSEASNVWLSRLDDASGCRARASRRIGPALAGYAVTSEGGAHVAVAPDGTVYVALTNGYEGGGFDASRVTVQAFDANGDPLWEPVLVTDNLAAYEYAFDIAADDTGVSVIFYDDNTGETHVQKVSAAGARVWDADGIYVTSDCCYFGREVLATAPAGDVVAFWNEGGGVRGQRWDAPDGSPVWTGVGTNGKLVSLYQANAGYEGAQVAAGPNGDWFILVNGYDAGYWLQAQRVDGDDGTSLWTGSAGSIVMGGSGPTQLSYLGPNLVRGGQGDLLVAWTEGASFVLAQRIDDVTGLMVWASPVAARPFGHSPYDATVVADGNDLIVVWGEGNGPDEDILAQKFSATDGALLWGPAALVSTAPGNQSGPTAVAGGQDGGVVVGWWDYRANGEYSDVYVQKLTADGQAGN